MSTTVLGRKHCPPHGPVERILTGGILLFLTWAVPWSILGDACLPGGNIFSLIITIDACTLGGLLVSVINKIPLRPPLPPLLGMLIAGFCLRNIPIINVAEDIDNAWSSSLRSFALAIILAKAGLELDASALKKMKGVCIRLTALPCIVETVTCGLSCRFLLGFPWEWGFMLGFVLGAVSPAVIVPSLLSLQEQGYGVDQGIPTLVIAASSFDDVLAISGFSVVLGIAFSQVSGAENVAVHGLTNSTSTDFMTALAARTVSEIENVTAFPPSNSTFSNLAEMTDATRTGELVWTIFRGPVEMVAGIAIGITVGVILWYLPAHNIPTTTRDRFLAVVGLASLALFGCRVVGFPGAGALAAIVLAFTAAFSWKDTKAVSEKVGNLWNIFEPIMFGLIGAEVSLNKLDSETLGFGVAILFIGLLTRSVTSFASVSCSNLNVKEKLFVCVAWLPKATVQAAIGSVALDTALNNSASPEILRLGRQVLTIAVLSILITAPLGAAAIGLSGPKLLRASGGGVPALRDDEKGDHSDCMVVEEQEAMPLKGV